jgi:hypothetical protein
MSKYVKGFGRFAGVGLPLAAVLVVGGCANMPTQNGGMGGDNTTYNAPADQSGCNAGKSAAMGAAIGAVLGALKGGERGALIGGVAGAAVGGIGCALYNAHYKSEQIASAQAVERQYQASHAGGLPAQTTVVAYHSGMQPTNTVVAGSQATLESRITVLQGRDAPLPKVNEQVVLLSPEGKQLTKFEKPATAVDGSGEYQSNFSFTLPKGIQQGRYTIQTTAIVDGKPVRTNTVPMVVV